MNELRIYNNKSMIKYFLVFTNVLCAILFLISSAITQEWFVFGISFLSFDLILSMIFLIWWFVTKSFFIFNKVGIQYYSNKKEKLNLKWEQITDISHTQMSLTDLPETRWSPYFIIITYKNEGEILIFTKPFSLKDIIKLTESKFHPILKVLEK